MLTYYAIKVVIIGCIMRNPPVMSVFIAVLWSIEAASYFCYCCFYLNEQYLQEICVQRTLMNNILLIFCFCFVQHCSSFSYIFCKCTAFLFPCVVFNSKMPLTVLNCHTILIENVFRLLFIASNYVHQ